MSQSDLAHGDFTPLAASYSMHRPGYSLTVRDALLGMIDKPPTEIDAADVGAGTGIWSRLMAERVRKVTAVEPNAEMRQFGIADSKNHRVQFHDGTGEKTGLPDASYDLVSMASSFHWVDFEAGTAEFHRILRPGGRFTALWNTRDIQINPLLVEIEAEISRLNPNIKRVSSGSSGITAILTEKLEASPHFADVIYLEGRHLANQTPEQYLGVWRSVNDVRVQLGPSNWQAFLAFVEQRTAGLDKISTTYRTRAWSARRR